MKVWGILFVSLLQFFYNMSVFTPNTMTSATLSSDRIVGETTVAQLPTWLQRFRKPANMRVRITLEPLPREKKTHTHSNAFLNLKNLQKLPATRQAEDMVRQMRDSR